MRKTICRLFTVAALAAVGASAYGKPPDVAERPTVEQIYQRAKADLKAELKRAELERQDPIGEAIQNYKDSLVPYTEYHQLVEVILNDQDERVQPYRRTATDALILRFAQSDDPAKRKVRREIALELIKLMKRSRDTEGLKLIEDLLYDWWRNEVVKFGFQRTDKIRDRARAYQRMKKFLEKEDK